MTSPSHGQSGLMTTEERLVYMVNQIARNCAAMGPEHAADTVEDHIRLYWDPLMRQKLVEQASLHPEDFSPIAAIVAERISGT
jgi:formate dehydrogenase subunit delta